MRKKNLKFPELVCSEQILGIWSKNEILEIFSLCFYWFSLWFGDIFFVIFFDFD
jgi:hypothetical protein